MVRKFECREDLPHLENALEVLVMSNVYNGTFVRQSHLCNGLPVFYRRRCGYHCDRGGWQLFNKDGVWTLANREGTHGPPRSWDPKKKIWIYDKGGEHEHEMNTTVEVKRYIGDPPCCGRFSTLILDQRAKAPAKKGSTAALPSVPPPLAAATRAQASSSSAARATPALGQSNQLDLQEPTMDLSKAQVLSYIAQTKDIGDLLDILERSTAKLKRLHLEDNSSRTVQAKGSSPLHPSTLNPADE